MPSRADAGASVTVKETDTTRCVHSAETDLVRRMSNASEAIAGDPACPLCGSTAELIFRRNHRGKDWFLARCKCGLHFTHPLPTPDEITEFYTGDYHEELIGATIDDQPMMPKFRHYIDRIKPHFPSGRSLDVGCTNGLFPYLMQQNGYQAEGIELNPKTAKWGAETYGVPIWTGSFDEFDGGGNRYDVITMTDVVEHTLNPLQTLKKLNRMLRRSGGAMITFPDITSAKSQYYRRVAQVTHRDWLWVTCCIPAHIWEFTQPVATRCFENAGFAVRSFERTEAREEGMPGKLALISLLARPFDLPWMAPRFGTQMEFVLEKVREVE